VRIAVTGAGGRLGRALIEALRDAPFTGPRGPIGWSRPAFDLDALDEDAAAALLDRDRPDVVVHAAAWTDVDGCARDPALALRRNGTATTALASACAARDVELAIISTNEVFDGTRVDGLGYRPDDEPAPANPYGASKLAAEQGAAAAYRDGGRRGLAIVRTSWLFGTGAPDFPRKIVAAARAARDAGEPLRVVADEWGSPTYTADLAEAIVALIGADGLVGGPGTIAVHHLVNAGVASRAGLAREVLRLASVDAEVVDVPASTWQRASSPPRWGVLEPTPLPSGEPMPSWQDALARYAPTMRGPPPRTGHDRTGPHPDQRRVAGRETIG